MQARRGSGLLLVMMDVDPAHEREFNEWYDEEHFPERATCPGVVDARRFRALEGAPKYLAYYELDSVAVLDSDAYQGIFPPSVWGTQVGRHVSNRVRNIYEDITPTVPPGFVTSAKRSG